MRGKIALALLGLAMPGSTIAVAQDFPNTLTMSCAEATAMVNNQNSVVLSTGPNVFNLYVKDQAFCAEGQITKPQWVQTRDVQQCPIGSTCVSPTLGGGR